MPIKPDKIVGTANDAGDIFYGKDPFAPYKWHLCNGVLFWTCVSKPSAIHIENLTKEQNYPQIWGRETIYSP